jgi:NADH:ubiquinone oxidoreductase subunit 6 (subunit J)
MNESAALEQAVQFHAGPLFWVLAIGTVVGCFAVVGRESRKATAIGMAVVVVSLGGLFAMAGAVIPAVLLAIPGIFLFAPLLKTNRDLQQETFMWRGVRPILAFVICLIVTLLTITLIQGTQVWLYAKSMAENASIDKLGEGISGRYLVAVVATAILSVIVWCSCRALDSQEQS